MIIRQITERRREARKRKKKLFRSFSIFLRLLIICLVLVGIFFLVKFCVSRFTVTKVTEVIEAHITEVPFTVSSRGIIVRKEKIYTSTLEGSLHQIVSEGQSVKKDGAVAKVYNYQLELSLKKRKIDLKKEGILSLLYLKRDISRRKIEDELFIYGLNNEIDTLREVLLTSDLKEARRLEKVIEEIVNKRQELVRQKKKYKSEVNARVQVLQKEYSHINNSLGTEVSCLLSAENSGIVSYYFDGYEGIFTPATVLENPMWDMPEIELSPVKIRDGQKILLGGPVFKLVEEPWYILTRVPSDKKDYFESKDDRIILLPDLNMQMVGSIEKIYDRGYNEPEILVVISTDNKDKTFLSKRELSLDILLTKVSGVVLPITAKVEKYGEVGVYVIEDEKLKFYPVRVKFEDKDQFVVVNLKEGVLVLPDARNFNEDTKIIIDKQVKNNQ